MERSRAPVAPPAEAPARATRPSLDRRVATRRSDDRAPGRGFTPYAVLGHVGSLAIGLRWATVTAGVVIAAGTGKLGHLGVAIAGALLVANTVYRTVRPIPLRHSRSLASEIALLADLAIVVGAVAMSGRWDSPFLLTPVPTALLAGYGWGTVPGLLLAALAAGSIGLSEALAETQPGAFADGVQGALVFGLAAIIGGFTRRIWFEVEEQRRAARDHLAPMETANDLLLALHGVVQTLPSSLDLGDVVASTRRRLRELFTSSANTMLVREESTDRWRVVLAEGVRLPSTLSDEELPVLLRDALGAHGATTAVDLLVDGRTGFSPLARSVLVTPLRARGIVIGLLAIEDITPDRFGEQDAELLDGLAGPLALAVDNAIWFARLQTLGAEAERARIARDLHDRLAQSLAYVAFELERIGKMHPEDREIGSLHDVVRDVVRELRETLYQLRAVVSEQLDLADVARPYLERFAERTGLDVTFDVRADGRRRLPIPVEQELWRVFQEALANLDRHAEARHAWVTWAIEPDRAWLEVRDDGRGFRPEAVSGDHYGLVGMRERADAIGARLVIESAPGRGARVLVELQPLPTRAEAS